MNTFNISDVIDKRKRATAKDVQPAAEVGNMQKRFFEGNGRFPTKAELENYMESTEEKFLQLLDKEMHTATPIPYDVMERAARLKAKGDAAKKRAEEKNK